MKYRWNFEDDEIRALDEDGKPATDLFAPQLEQYGLGGWRRITNHNHFVQCYIRDHRMLLLTEAESGQQARDYMLSYVQFCIRQTNDISELGVA
jgi:hypothetical protein